MSNQQIGASNSIQRCHAAMHGCHVDEYTETHRSAPPIRRQLARAFIATTAGTFHHLVEYTRPSTASLQVRTARSGTSRHRWHMLVGVEPNVNPREGPVCH